MAEPEPLALSVTDVEDVVALSRGHDGELAHVVDLARCLNGLRIAPLVAVPDEDADAVAGVDEVEVGLAADVGDGQRGVGPSAARAVDFLVLQEDQLGVLRGKIPWWRKGKKRMLTINRASNRAVTMKPSSAVCLVDDVAGFILGHVECRQRRLGEDLDCVIKLAGRVVADGKFVDRGALVIRAPGLCLVSPLS